MAVDDTIRAQGKCGFIPYSGKPCGRPAGWGTEHVGQGCCKTHGGNGGRPPIHGKYAGQGEYKRYDVIAAPRLRELGEHFEADPNPLDLLPEVVLLRALITDFAERYEEATNALIAWHSSFSREYQSEVRAWHKANEGKTEKDYSDMPDPVGYGKPRQVADILQVGRFIAEIGSLADKIQRQREQATIPKSEADAFWKRLAQEMVRGLFEAVDDEDLRTKLTRTVQRRWDALTPPGSVAARA